MADRETWRQDAPVLAQAAHIGLGADTGQIVAASLTTKDVDDGAGGRLLARSSAGTCSLVHRRRNLSQQVKRLEQMLGCGLFERDRRGLRLTSHGERLFSQARKLIALNDEIWPEMTTVAVEGRVRLGVPPDLVGSHLAPVLKAYGDAFPWVELSLACAPFPELAEALAMGRVDLAVVEEPAGPSAGERLGIERLVWIGAKAGTAHLKRPLPVSMVAGACAFRPATSAALTGHGMGWRTVFENGSMEAALATVRADMAVSAWLTCAVPPDLDILPSSFGLPELPAFAITLHLPRHPAGAAAAELARHIRDRLARHRRAA